MSEEKAAEKIQASFRGYKTRKTLKNNGVLPAKEEKTNGEGEEKSKEGQTEENNSAKPNSTQSTDQEILDIDLTDKDLEKAAFKIQASYRNFSKKKKEEKPSSPVKEKEEPVQNDAGNQDENLEDIDLGDPEVEKAALKIQSTFRGYKVRKEVKDEDGMTNGEKGSDEA